MRRSAIRAVCGAWRWTALRRNFPGSPEYLSLAKSGEVMERLLHQYDGNDLESKNAASETESNASTDKIRIALAAVTGSTERMQLIVYCILYQPGEGAGNTTEGIGASASLWIY
ncbi:MAG: hypothetical protein ACLUD2_13300 [Clostridium sp.]